MVTRDTRATIAAHDNQRGLALMRRASLSFCAVLAMTQAAWAHHVPVTAEVPGWNLFLAVALGLLLLGEAACLVTFRRRGDSRRVEQLWMTMPLTVLLVLGVVRVLPMLRAPVVLASPAADALRVEVRARQWQWDVHYPEAGVDSVGEIHLPAGRDVQLRLTSRDIAHSFDVPKLGIRQDVLPGQTATLNLRIPTAGRYEVYCSALCGTSAEEMAGVIAVEAPDEYTAWVANKDRKTR